MSDLRLSLSVECGRDVDAGDQTVKSQHEYENVPTTHAADSLVAEISRRKLTKKPKPGPKPNYVAVRVAELNLKQKINSNETSFHISPTKPAQHGCPGPTPERAAVEKSSTSRWTNSELASDAVQKLTEQNVSWSDDDVYDTAVRVEQGVVLRRDVAASADEKYSPTSTTTNTGVSPWYDDTPSDDEEPIYDEAIVVVAREEPLYEEATVVQANRLQTVLCEEQEPLYAEPAEILADAAATEQYSDEDSFLYEEALPVDKMAIPRGATATNC